MTAIRPNRDPAIWCDVCKSRWGYDSTRKDWHPLAKRPAQWITESQSMERKGKRKAYCQQCANDVQYWADGSYWSLKDQIEYAVRKEQLHGMGSE
jgi:hypothetical protein